MGTFEHHDPGFWQKLGKFCLWTVNAIIVFGNLAAALIALYALYVLLTGHPFP